MDVKLIITSGKASKGSVTVKTPTVIGRSKQADLTIGHPLISRRHCELCETEGVLMIRDLESLNGTMVSGQRVTEATLRPGDEFCIGPITFQADYQPAERLPEAPVEEAAPAVGDSTTAIPSVSGPAGDDAPDFGFLAPAADSTSDTPASGISNDASPPDWDEMTPEHLPDSQENLVEAEEIEDFEEIEEEFGGFEIADEEPEPTPPPPMPPAKPAASQSPPAPPKPIQSPPPPARHDPAHDDEVVNAWEEVQSEAAEDLITGGTENSKIGKRRKLWPFGNGKDEPDAPSPDTDAAEPLVEVPAAAAKPAARKPRPAGPPPAAPRQQRANGVPEFLPAPDAEQKPAESDDDALNDFFKGLQ